MGRSRMFDDEAPENAIHPSPRTTIVGGRPPEDKAPTPPVPTGLQRLLRLASVDEGFAKELIEKRDATAGPANVELNDRERAMLRAVPGEQLAEMIINLPPPPEGRRDFLRQTAATAVVLLGGAVLSDCEGSCGKGAAVPEDQVQRPTVVHRTKGLGADEFITVPKDAPPTAGIRPDEPPPQPPRPEEMHQTRGIRPDVPPPPPQGGQYSQPPPGWDGGEPPPVRPDLPPPPTGIRPDLPPPPPPKPDGGTPPDQEPEPPRPDQPNPTRGIRPGLKSFGHDTGTE